MIRPGISQQSFSFQETVFDPAFEKKLRLGGFSEQQVFPDGIQEGQAVGHLYLRKISRLDAVFSIQHTISI
jgi:hypothetical protein